MNVLVFDIETIPDLDYGRRALGLEGLSDEQVGKAMFSMARGERGSEFLPYEQQRVIAISCVLRSRDNLRIWSLGDLQSSEAQIVQRFFDGIERYTPDLVSWNGGSFDLPVLHYRAMRWGIAAPRYWETGAEDQSFRFNNYLSRYHWRHVDLMDVLSGYHARARASLSSVAALLGLPGKLGFSGAQVWDAWLAGNLEGIRRYCETDVLNTWLVYLRFERMRGRLSAQREEEEIDRVRQLLEDADEPHFAQFLAMWDAAPE